MHNLGIYRAAGGKLAQGVEVSRRSHRFACCLWARLVGLPAIGQCLPTRRGLRAALWEHRA